MGGGGREIQEEGEKGEIGPKCQSNWSKAVRPSSSLPLNELCGSIPYTTPTSFTCLPLPLPSFASLSLGMETPFCPTNQIIYCHFSIPHHSLQPALRQVSHCSFFPFLSLSPSVTPSLYLSYSLPPLHFISLCFLLSLFQRGP